MITPEVLEKLKPMLAVSAEPFDSGNFLYEVKWDGFRSLAYLGESTVLQSRNKLDFSSKFPELSLIHRQALVRPLIIDGEIIIMEDGVPSFYELQKRGWGGKNGVIARAARTSPATYVVFDILYRENDNLMNLPLTDRKKVLRQVLRPNERICISEGIEGRGIEFYHACIERDLEGIVAKKMDSPYLPGKRSSNWRKIKKSLEGEFIVCGYKQTSNASRRVDALILGCLIENKLVFQGAVGVGLGGVLGEKLYNLLLPLHNILPLFRDPQDTIRGVTWVKPSLCCSVQFLEPARDGGLRHPVFRGLRTDLGPEDCTGIAGAIAGRRQIL